MHDADATRLTSYSCLSLSGQGTVTVSTSDRYDDEDYEYEEENKQQEEAPCQGQLRQPFSPWAKSTYISTPMVHKPNRNQETFATTSSSLEQDEQRAPPSYETTVSAPTYADISDVHEEIKHVSVTMQSLEEEHAKKLKENSDQLVAIVKHMQQMKADFEQSQRSMQQQVEEATKLVQQHVERSNTVTRQAERAESQIVALENTQKDLQAQLDDTRYKLETTLESEKRTKKTLSSMKLMVTDRNNQMQEQLEGLSHSLSRTRAKQQQAKHHHEDSQHQTIESLKLDNSRLRRQVSDSQSMSDMRTIDMSVTSTSMEPIVATNDHKIDLYGSQQIMDGEGDLLPSSSPTTFSLKSATKRGLSKSVNSSHVSNQGGEVSTAGLSQGQSENNLSGSWARRSTNKRGEERSLLAGAEEVMRRREALRARANAGAGGM
jgi:hypothetical protein